ncbi:aldehyde dehydrogenase [Hypericibacter terrae]|uniref:Aldehyde dehydrogenase n=1 Tax=Hypericibacter terrae TaxID=2602015 RepID=A0A5J6MNT7_9PROT|nr:aldehyde dehydrogenase [Hypericibacter terrae]QEX17720.1 aldehyde dehydrogenase [Hypericibacter terrae]
MSAALSIDMVKDQASRLTFRNQAFINGKYVPAASGKTFDCINPATGKAITQVAEGDKEDVDRAVKAARAAFDKGSWSRMAPTARKKILMKFAALIEKHTTELALLETMDMGKPIRDSSRIDIPLAAQAIGWYAEAIDKIYDEIAPTGREAVSLIRREPVGVVAAVVPWNFPLLMASWKIGPALATGNSMVVKPAEQSPLTVIRIAELAAEAGIPEGVFNVVPGFGETAGQALGRHMDVDCVTFTGSTEVGKFFLRYSGESNMKQVSLECGGKSPNIIMADAPDLDAAATAAAWGIFFNQGEVCNAGSRLIVEESVKDQVLEKVMAVGKKLVPGDPLDPKTGMGAIVDKTQMERVLGYIDAGKKEGARLAMGGNRVKTDSGGYYVEPTVFDKVDNKMKIAQEEIFGPVLSTITFKTPEEAVKIGNDTIYGLAAAIWTKDITKAFKVSDALRAGVVWVNCFDNGHISSPFGGFKQSGFGRDKSLHAMDKYSQLKATWIHIGG